MSALEVLAPGPLTLVTDGGRPGLAAIGVSPSGAFDRAAHALGNRLAGNPDGAAGLEVTFGGLRVRAHGDVLLVLTGADAQASIRPGADAAVARAASVNTPLHLREGDELRLGSPKVGLRSYLAVRGGLDVPLVLGSAATDVLSGLGPAPLRAGEALPIGGAGGDFPGTDLAVARPPAAGPLLLRALAGPRDDWFDLAGLADRAWTISPAANRVGVRLIGEPLSRRAGFRGRELPSEPTVRGAVQVPADGQPVIFGPDHPTTGGYPVIAVLTPASVDALAQGRPAQVVRLGLSRG